MITLPSTLSGCASWIPARSERGIASSTAFHATITSSRSSTTSLVGVAASVGAASAAGPGVPAGFGTCLNAPSARFLPGFAGASDAASASALAARAGSRRRGLHVGRGFGTSGRLGTRRGLRRCGRSVREALLEPFDAIGEDLDRTAGLAPGQPDECDLEHESRIGRVGAAHVHDGLAERLEAAHEDRVAEHVADALEPLALVLGRVDVDLAPPATSRKASRSDRRRSSAMRRASWPDSRSVARPVERAGDVLGSDGVEDRDPGVEG